MPPAENHCRERTKESFLEEIILKSRVWQREVLEGSLLSAEKGEFRGDLAANVWAGCHNLPGEAQDPLSGYIPRDLFSSSWEMKGGQS